MTNHQREIAGAFVGVASLMLIYNGSVNEAMMLLIGMLSFFIGEKNGEKRAKTKETVA